MPWARVLACGDYLSPVEIPMLSAGGSGEAYVATLERLQPLVEQAETVVPGHGEPMNSSDALAILAEDVAYLDELMLTESRAPLPPKRDTPTQRRIHHANAKLLARLS
jgi:glyoxylase-like metal-dependent hydrolase (beta-lactamase superfamily II)